MHVGPVGIWLNNGLFMYLISDELIHHHHHHQPREIIQAVYNNAKVCSVDSSDAINEIKLVSRWRRSFPRSLKMTFGHCHEELGREHIDCRRERNNINLNEYALLMHPSNS
ncbi:hypothetical protein D8674_036195 [Pyrus ussuriensis x Pyrus communis]|uniref:Uncharacterized protein n=1 Tax=Pyrus ussuriensis x Pyrus communis TaxID=2448454 RepID=A0A5N5GEF9_9ROSA|nr:hypothetical protein D8674_036195 [Pyrus ussuriensis x Pyrus communis]